MIVIHPDLISSPPDPALTHARIGYESIVTETNVSAENEISGRGPELAAVPSTFDFWEPSSVPARWIVDVGAGVPATVDYVGVAAHTAGSDGAALKIQHRASSTASWVDASPLAVPTDDEPILFLFPPTTDQQWAVRVQDAACAIGVVYIGQALAMQRRIYGGHAPITLSRQTTTRPVRSEGGQFLGRSIVRAGVRTAFAWENLEPAWVRTNLDPFIVHARTRPFFIAWRPLDWSEVAYGSVDDDIAPGNTGTRDLMDVGFTVNGLAAGTETPDWTPLKAGSALLWYHDVFDGPLTLSSGLVDQWDDLSGNDRHWTQSGSARPDYVDDGNGAATVRFDGTEDVLSMAGTLPSLEGITVLVVYTVRSRDDFAGVLSAAASSGADHVNFWTLEQASAASGDMQLFGRSAETDTLAIQRPDTGQIQLALLTIDDGAATFEDLAGEDSDTYDGGAFGTPDQIVLGARYNSGAFGFGAVDVYTTVAVSGVSEGIKERLVDWATARFGLS